MPKKSPYLAIVPLLLMALATPVFSQPPSAQGSGSSRATPTAPKPPTVDEFAASLWQFIHRDKAPYQQWPSSSSAPVAGVDNPHGAGSSVYSDVAAKSWQQPSHGSILVREEHDTEQKLRGVSVMYRVKGTAPQTNDWYWILYQPDGKLAKSPGNGGGKPVIGQLGTCIACHRKAPGQDLVFSNDIAPELRKDR